MGDRGVVIVGSGPAGLSAALSLCDLGVRALVIERAGEVAAAWRGRYDRLKLNTGRQFSHLPGRRYPKGTPVYPSRDQVVEHFASHARESGVELRVDTEVKRIDRGSSGWSVSTSDGEIEARNVVVATGYQHTPVIPDWPGCFAGELSHSYGYRNPAPYAGKRVLVVGSGSSGMEIAHDLTTGRTAKVWLSVRTPPNIMARKGPAGLPVDVLSIPLYHLPARLSDRIAAAARRRAFGDLSEFGLPVPAEGPFARAHRLHVAPSIVDLEVVDAIRAGSVEVVSALRAFEDGDAVLDDASRISPDAVIAATGYRTGLQPLVGHLGVLGSDGVPLHLAPAPAADGLYFHGMLTRPAVIGYVAKQSRALAKRIAANERC
ncbi:FAD-dependent oxidoreductase [Mycobacterium triplex]|uniref:FAD-dependent oxidoreductase n=1 Tax=Mycobacterium triplex TaxID=47839 RepID=A0A024JVQ0_9MYCO|nr:NAD(P)/FAD-dependent oxidoreductase [Mycobacterium triplex]ORW99505.1 FAD-dependent oxidoreductase [Mycobacterium triplex]CDO87686.1 FAD dependent oxidoreductase [Mycobacterium triplex]